MMHAPAEALGAAAALPEDFDPLAAVNAWLARHNVPPSRFGRVYFHDPRLVFDLRAGRTPRDLMLRRLWHITRQPPGPEIAARPVGRPKKGQG
jgi:hypothetical protein